MTVNLIEQKEPRVAQRNVEGVNLTLSPRLIHQMDRRRNMASRTRSQTMHAILAIYFEAMRRGRRTLAEVFERNDEKAVFATALEDWPIGLYPSRELIQATLVVAFEHNQQLRGALPDLQATLVSKLESLDEVALLALLDSVKIYHVLKPDIADLFAEFEVEA